MKLKQILDPETIFIYQMGKVGSTSLELGINKSFHVHCFYLANHTCPARIKVNQIGLKNRLKRCSDSLFRFLQRTLFKVKANKKIITLVRNPVERNMSMFFHDIDAYLFMAHTNFLNTRKQLLPTRNQSSTILEDVFTNEFDHNYPLCWFDNEFYKTTGINIYSYRFDKKVGYIELEERGHRVICLAQETLNKNLDKIESFLDCSINISEHNSADMKWYADIYHKFKTEFEIPAYIKYKLENSKFYQHFYQ
ncbi:putative capsular polysaccharide synthesis family protein [Marinifaba aquimaris]|uniref:putative capsular polysaccharide synthesis family protein n=1 Tax=Marinifaba aquimaris TaxID=2741323 RepID=UPI0015747C25|nr:putative capsular polysaccharide synthesis family protein [Marinifaba aquimaris]